MAKLLYLISAIFLVHSPVLAEHHLEESDTEADICSVFDCVQRGEIKSLAVTSCEELIKSSQCEGIPESDLIKCVDRNQPTFSRKEMDYLDIG